jgi:hypothetical protein
MGAETAVVMIPLWVQLDQDRLAAVLESRGASIGPITLDRPQQVIRGFAGPEGIPVIDLLPEFTRWQAARDGRRLFLRLDGHLTEDGHALATEIVARELVGRGLVRSALDGSRGARPARRVASGRGPEGEARGWK